MNPALFKSFPATDVSAFFTERTADFVLPADATGLSATQKQFLLGKFQLDPAKVFTARQVHGSKILLVSNTGFPQHSIPEADAMVTNVPGVILSVRTADCLPIFLFDPKKKAIGLVHTGWRGSSQRIVIMAIETMKKNYGSDPADILVELGPAIRQCCYEVGEEFRDIFSQAGEVLRHKQNLYLDLSLVNEHQMQEAGLKAAHIVDSQQCTMCNPQFFSYRRDKEKAGRHLSLLVLN